MDKRLDQEIAIINQHKKIEVNLLAEILKVSKVTIRKDLTELEARGLIQRKHGYALINSQDNLNFRLATNYRVKQQIAIAAAKLVENNETIMIESGSTCALLAEQLGKENKHVTIITISYFIANFVAKYSNLDVILLGGEYQSDSQVVVGPFTKQTLQNFRVEKLFAGTDGFELNNGFWGNDIMRVDTVKAMAQRAQQLLILTDSSKFQKTSTVKQFNLNDVAKVITDQQIKQETAKNLTQHGIQVIQAH